MALALQLIDVILSFKGRLGLTIDLVFFRERLLSGVRLKLVVAEFGVGGVFLVVCVKLDGACFGVSMHDVAIMIV